MGTAAAGIITAAIAATAAIAKGVRAAKDRKERKVQQNAMQDQMTTSIGKYEAQRRDQAHDKSQAMHASMEMYSPVFEQMKEMYGKGGYEIPDFEGAMRANESRPDPASDTRPIKDTRPDTREDKGLEPMHPMAGPGDKQTGSNKGSGHTPMAGPGDKQTGSNKGSGHTPMNTTGGKTSSYEVGGH